MASDGKWYPPTAAPGGPPPQQVTGPAATGQPGNLWRRFRRLPMAAQVVSWVAVAVVVIAAAGSAGSKNPSHPIAVSGSTKPSVSSTPSEQPTTTAARPTTTVAATTVPPTTSAVTSPPTIEAPVVQTPVVTSPPATSSPTPVAPTASCYPTTSTGNCYEPGEYCPTKDHGMTGVAGDGKQIKCEDNNGWRWEPIS